MLNVAFPSIGTEPHASASGLQWVIDVYPLVLAPLLPEANADRLAADGPSGSG